MQCHLATSPTTVADFKPVETRSALILEANQRVLILDDVNGQWGLPGGVIINGEEPKATMTRLFKEQLSPECPSEQIRHLGVRYVRTDHDFLTHFYFCQLKEIPSTLQIKGKWISIFALPLLPSIAVRQEVFDIVYKERIWQRVEDVNQKATLAFRKKGQTLLFGANRRLIINLIGLPNSGKATQAAKLSKVYGLPEVSDRALVASQFGISDTFLSGMLNSFIRRHKNLNLLPGEITIGIVVKKLSQPECQPGCILNDFPITQEQREAIFKIFTRHVDCHIPILLNVPEAIAKARFDQVLQSRDGLTAEQTKAEQKAFELRVTKLNENQEGLIREIGSQLINLDLENKNADEVFHLLSEQIQKHFDDLAAKEIALPPPKKEGQLISTPGRRFPVPLFFGTALVSFILGGFLFKKIPFTYIGRITSSSNS